MSDWFLSRYSRQELAEILENHPLWDNDIPQGAGRAKLASILEELDLVLTAE